MIERIAVINDLARPQGGASLLALSSARAFAAAGLKVSVIAGDERPEPDARDTGIEFHCLGQKRLLDRGRGRSLISGVYNRTARDHVAAWIDANDSPDTVYHVHGWSQILSPSLFDALAPVHDRVVMTAHDFFLTCPNGAHFDFSTGKACHRVPLGMSCLAAACDRRSRAQKLWRCARQGVQRLTLPPERVPRQLLIHEAMRPFMTAAGIPDWLMTTLPNPVTPWCPERIDVAGNKRDILFVGRLEATKGIDLAATACRQAGARLVAIGDGAMLESLQTQFPEMKFVGRLPPEKIGAYARAARALVMPSRHMEPFGLTAMEALWSGLPVVVSENALLAGDIVATGAGFAIDPTDTDGFAAVLTHLLADDELAAQMSDAAYFKTRHLALEPDVWVSALLAAYCQLLERTRERGRDLVPCDLAVQSSSTPAFTGTSV